MLCFDVTVACNDPLFQVYMVQIHLYICMYAGACDGGFLALIEFELFCEQDLALCKCCHYYYCTLKRS